MEVLRGTIFSDDPNLREQLEDVLGKIRAFSLVRHTITGFPTEERLATFLEVQAPAIVFIDMPSGSCMFAAMHRLREMPGMRLVTGVNLAMLLEFVFHRDGDLDDVASKVADAGASAIGMR